MKLSSQSFPRDQVLESLWRKQSARAQYEIFVPGLKSSSGTRAFACSRRRNPLRYMVHIGPVLLFLCKYCRKSLEHMMRLEHGEIVVIAMTTCNARLGEYLSAARICASRASMHQKDIEETILLKA